MCMCCAVLSHPVVSAFVTPMTVARQPTWGSLWDSPGKKLEWVAIPFARGSSRPRDQTQVSHTAGGFFTVSATREAQESKSG